MTQIFSCLKFCYISSSIKIYILKQSHENAFLQTFSFNLVMPSGDKRLYKLKETYREKLQICLNVRDLLLPPSINGVNSHKNNSMISRLIINYINPFQSSVTLLQPLKIFRRGMFSLIRFPEEVFSDKLVKRKVFASCL